MFLGSDILKKAVKMCLLSLCCTLGLILILGAKARAIEYKFNMSYIFSGSSESYTALVDSAQRSLNEVSPNYFYIDYNGDLALTSAVSEAFVSDMHNRGITVVPFLTNDFSRAVGKTALEKRTKLAESLAGAVRRYALDGVNIDIENVTPGERDAYVDFVRLLRNLLPAGKTIAVSVAANPWGSDVGWQGSYDYAGLARFADYLMVMCYDEHYYGGPSGPVSSLPYLDKALKYAVSVVPKEKIVLGLPFYGRIWGDSDAFPNGYGLTNARIAQLVSSYGGEVSIDPASQSTRAVLTVGEDSARPAVGGQLLDAGTYTIWYESQESIKAKLSLVSKYDIKGTGSWALGQETPDTWRYYKLWLNNCTFSDIQDNWAKDSIMVAYLNHWVNGRSPDTFSPDEPLTREQATVILVRRLGLTPELDPSVSFDDTGGSWSQAYLETARKNHIISGIGDNLFAPGRPVTRQELAVMINNVLKYQTGKDTVLFPDVSPVSNPWSVEAIGAVAAAGIIPADPDGTFRPSDIVTRAEMTVFISKIIVPS